MTTIIIIVVIVLLVFWVISVYNGLVRCRNARENAFANIDVQLKQRHDLIPQLVESDRQQLVLTEDGKLSLQISITG